MVIKIASHWMFAENGTVRTLPNLNDIQRYKNMGFNGIMFGEIQYNHQREDFDNIFNGINGWSITNNPILTTLINIKNAGLKAYFILNPNRFGGTTGFLTRTEDRTKFRNALTYISSLNVIDGISFEEPLFWAGFTLSNQFFRECRNIVPSHIFYWINVSANTECGLMLQGIDWITINREHLIDAIQPQPGKGPAPNYLITNEIILGSYNTFRRLMPNILCLPTIYVIYSTAVGSKHNVNLVSNIQFVLIDNGWDITVWPADLITNATEIAAITALLNGTPDTCPSPQYNYTITQE